MEKKRHASSSYNKTKHSAHTSERTAGEKEIEHAILRNLVELQKVNADLSEKFSHLTKEISQLLALFEVTARNFAKNAPPTEEYAKDKDFVEKIDKLLDQNKVLAKGLTLMEERLRERMYGTPPPSARERRSEEGTFEPSMASRNRPMPRF